ncbi:MAG TPA: PEP-CTERM sorting domain-containing protein [Candidatus Nitrosotalea sp.]|nr:PEP-CTERM sorting domain-containing protein [Candidatus Nitrosotalea sp.]
MKSNSAQSWLLGATGAAALATGLNAGPFVYNPQDLLVGFQSASGTSEFVADIGQASDFISGAAAGTTWDFSSQLGSAFSGLDGLSLSVSGDVRTSGSPTGPLNTLFVTQARTDINTPTTPWTQKSSLNQGNTGANIDTIANNTVAFSSANSAGPNNTATAVVMPKGTAYNAGMGDSGDYNGSFQGVVEGTTQTGFAAGSTPLRLDLYEMKPVNGSPATFLGTLDFNPNGTMSFTAVPEPSTWALLGIGGLMFVATRRFRQTT